MKSSVIVLGSVLLALVCFSGAAARTADDVIEEIIEYHGCYDREADEKVDELLTELTDMDERRGALWRDIMDYWDYVNSDLPVHENRLPNGLPDDDSLCIVVLGFELNDDGTMKEELIGRLQVALAGARQYPNACVLCTGGGTAAGAPETGSRSEFPVSAMARSLTLLPPRDISISAAREAAETVRENTRHTAA